MIQGDSQTLFQQIFDRLDRLGDDLRRTDTAAQRADNAANLLKMLWGLTNQMMVREAFLMEILRQKGLLRRLDIEAIEKAVRAEYADDPGYGVSKRRADLNVKMVLGELNGVFKQPEDYDPDWDK